VDDSSVSIGRRYARNDELGTPYGITVDFACTCLISCLLPHPGPAPHFSIPISGMMPKPILILILMSFAAVQKGTITLRERDTTGQLIGSLDEVIGTVVELVNGTIDWPAACERLPAYDGVQAVDA
jgi:glycyl-tRNA synthetase